MPANSLPPDGTRVRAMTYESIEYDRPAEEVTGALERRTIAAWGGRTQCWVDGAQVDPATVRAESTAAFAEDAAGHEHKGSGEGGGQFISKSDGGSGESKDGEAPSGHAATAVKWLEGSALSAELKDKYAAHMTAALGKLPAGARAKAIESIGRGGVTFHADLKALRANFLKDGGSKSEVVRLVGYVRQPKGSDKTYLNVDGADASATDPQYTAEGVYLHELGHAADPDSIHSSDPKWESAWKREIFSPPAGKQGLTKYARESASEGFAEAVRVLSQKGADEFKVRFPKCFKFLESKGLT